MFVISILLIIVGSVLGTLCFCIKAVSTTLAPQDLIPVWVVAIVCIGFGTTCLYLGYN